MSELGFWNAAQGDPRDPDGKLYKRKRRDPYWKDRQRAI